MAAVLPGSTPKLFPWRPGAHLAVTVAGPVMVGAVSTTVAWLLALVTLAAAMVPRSVVHLTATPAPTGLPRPSSTVAVSVTVSVPLAKPLVLLGASWATRAISTLAVKTAEAVLPASPSAALAVMVAMPGESGAVSMTVA